MGIVLVVLGGLLLALNLGWKLPLAVWDYWPIALIVPGLVAIVAPSRHLNRSGGIWLLATGVYCQISITDFFGLGWFTAWPVFVIAYGLDMIIGSGPEMVCVRDGGSEPPKNGNDDRVSHER
jgi:hypothetical protein